MILEVALALDLSERAYGVYDLIDLASEISGSIGSERMSFAARSVCPRLPVTRIFPR